MCATSLDGEFGESVVNTVEWVCSLSSLRAGPLLQRSDFHYPPNPNHYPPPASSVLCSPSCCCKTNAQQTNVIFNCPCPYEARKSQGMPPVRFHYDRMAVVRLRPGAMSNKHETPIQWLKWFCEAGGGLTWRSQVGANPIPIPTPLIWHYLGIK